jgi:hypothetical protein
VAGLRWLVGVGAVPLGVWGVAMGWGQAAVYSHARRLRVSGWVLTCSRTRGEGSLIYATRAGVRISGVSASSLDGPPAPVSWPHVEACAWTAAWLTARGRGLVGSREMLTQRSWRGELRWYERGELRRRGHRPDLAGRLPTGGLLPIEVELAEKSPARLKAVMGLHATWVSRGKTPAVMYVCGHDELATRVRTEGRAAGLSVERGTLRVELLGTIREEAIAACRVADTEWHRAQSSVGGGA